MDDSMWAFSLKGQHRTVIRRSLKAKDCRQRGIHACRLATIMKMATFSEDRIGSTAMNDSIDLTALDTVDGTMASLRHDWW